MSTPLLLAVKKIKNGNGLLEVVRLLIDAGCDVDHRDDGGWTALMYASCEGYEGIVRLLIDGGCYVDFQSDGRTALMFVFHWNHEGIIRLLKDKNDIFM